MRIIAPRRHRQPVLPGIVGVARVDRRTKNLAKRLRPGEIAIIDHADLDRVAAESLVERGVAVVVNVAASISGRYPNLGPEVLVTHRVPLIDCAGTAVLTDVRDGDVIRVDTDAGTVHAGERVIATGIVQTARSVEVSMTEARAGLAAQLEAFAANTMEFLRRERDLLLDGVGVPAITTDLENRQALVVVRGYDYRDDLQALRPYIREYRPALIGVDGGADALFESGYTPTLIVGDMDSVSDACLCSGAELVVHAYRDGTAPGLDRVRKLGLDAKIFPATGTSEDVALLLADSKGASLIVAVGTHATLGEFLDKGRSGMASTFLTRLRVGGKLVDAKGVSRLYRSRISTPSLLLLVAAAAITLAVVIAASPVGQVYLTILGARWDSFVSWLARLF